MAQSVHAGIDYESNPDDSAKYLDEYFKERGITLSSESLMKEFKPGLSSELTSR